VSDPERACELDRRDPLRQFRDRFVFDPEVTYLDGNSLGCLPSASLERLQEVIAQQWGQRGIRGWEEGWMNLPESVGERLAAVALGAAPGQTIVGDSTTVCFYKLACAALDARPGRREIVTDVGNFPTDRYVLEGIARGRGLQLTWVDAPGAEAIGPQTALVSFSHVSYRSAEIADMGAISSAAREAGALTLWDLSHSAGSIPVRLDDDGARLAVGCTYKYLHGGPGAPAYMYVARELQSELRQPIWGWLGRRDPFEMAAGYDPAPGMRAFTSGTPPVPALVAVDEGVRVIGEAGIEAIRNKGIALTEYAIALADEIGVAVGSPREAERRGAHVAVVHPDARDLCRALIERGVIVDFRAPDIIRFGFAPLTTRFVDVYAGLVALADLVRTGPPGPTDVERSETQTHPGRAQTPRSCSSST
jgi:kynureninase